MAYMVPVAGGPGQGVAGAAVVEEVVEPGSDFNLEVRALDRGDTGEYVVFDRTVVVVASSDEARVAKDLDDERLLTATLGVYCADDCEVDVADVRWEARRGEVWPCEGELEGAWGSPGGVGR